MLNNDDGDIDDDECWSNVIYRQFDAFFCWRLGDSQNHKRWCFHTQKVYTHRRLCAQKLLHTEVLTQRSLCTYELLNREALTQKLFTHWSFYTQRLLHREVFTQRSFYTQMCLRILSTHPLVKICGPTNQNHAKTSLLVKFQYPGYPGLVMIRMLLYRW